MWTKYFSDFIEMNNLIGVEMVLKSCTTTLNITNCVSIMIYRYL